MYGAYCQGFTEVPPDIPEDAAGITLGGNRIKLLKANSFNHSSCLSLTIFWDELENIEIGAFNNLDNLVHLILVNNKLKTLTPGIFNNLASLSYLELNYNHLNNIESGVMNRLESLQSLQMFGNALESIDEGAFHNLTKLSTLRIEQNNIKTLQPLTFEGMSSLTGLYLQDNDLNYLPPQIFSNLSKLMTLVINNNELNTLSWDIFSSKQDEHPNFIYLAISGNPLECNSSLCWAYEAEQDKWLNWLGGAFGAPQCTALITWSQIGLVCSEKDERGKLANS